MEQLHDWAKQAGIFKTEAAVRNALLQMGLVTGRPPPEGRWFHFEKYLGLGDFIEDFDNIRCTYEDSRGHRCRASSEGRQLCSRHEYTADVDKRITTLFLCLARRGLSFLINPPPNTADIEHTAACTARAREKVARMLFDVAPDAFRMST